MDEKKALKIKILAEEGAFHFKKLFPIGDSYAVVVPKFWVKFHCVRIEGNYYMKLSIDEGSLILSPITNVDLEGITIKRKGD